MVRRHADRRDKDGGDASWMGPVVNEMLAAQADVLVVDRSADAKFVLTGPGVNRWLDRVAPRWVGATGARRTSIDLRPLPGPAGHVEAMVRSFARGPNECVLSSTPDQHDALTRWLRRAAPPTRVAVHPQTATHACLEFYGRRRTHLLRTLSDPGLEIREDRISDSTTLRMPAAAAAPMWTRLTAVGRDFDLAVGGERSEEALRISRGTPAFGREIMASTLASDLFEMAGSGMRTGHGARTLGAFSSPSTALGFGGGEAIFAGDRRIGELTSRLRLPGWPATLALGLLDFTIWRGEALQAIVEGTSWPLEPRETPWEIAMRIAMRGQGRPS